MKTMMGMSAADMQKVHQAVADASAQPAAGTGAADASAQPAAGAGGAADTPGSDLGDIPLPTSSKRPPEASPMLGRTLPSSSPPPGGDAAPGPELPKPAPVPAAGGGRTMLGAPGVGMQLPEPVKKPPAGGPAGGRTMLGGPGPLAAGMPAAGLPADSAPAPPVAPSAPAAMPDDADFDLPPVARGGKGRRLGIVLALVGLLLGAVALGVLTAGHASDVRARIVATDDGEAILFEVPQSDPGAKIQFGQQTAALEGGSATFPLGADALKVGDNVVLAKLLDGSGDAQDVRITLAVQYRIRVDTGPLEAGKSQIDVVVSALPGTEVQLDGEPVKLDAEGRVVKSYPLDLSSVQGGALEHHVKYRVQPPSGEAVVDELVTRVMVTSLQLDSPGASLVTDADSVQIAGAVDKGTTVTVDGKDVAVSAGRFLTTFPLPKVGKYAPVVQAQLAGRAPHRIELALERVADLAAAAAEFEVNREIDYAKLSQNAAMYKGQQAAFEGRVFHVMVEGQKAALQMLVRDCPNNCSLWVDYPAGLEVKKGGWVRVLGTIEGVQQFRSAKNEVASVPKLRAAFVVPVEP